MHILIIDHYVGSPDMGMEYRPYYLAKKWVEMGHNVSIIGASYSHLRFKQPISAIYDLAMENVNGILYYWIKTPKYNSALSRIINIFSFVRKTFKYSKLISKTTTPDIVIASSTYPLDIYPAKRIASYSNAKLCYEVHDLWPLSPMIIGGYPKWHPFIITMQIAENYAYKHADKVISLLWNAESHMREHGLPPGKFKCIPNGYNKEDWQSTDEGKSLPEMYHKSFFKLKDKFVVGFAGGFATSGSLTTLIDAATILKFNENIIFCIVGKGPEEDILKDLAKDRSLTNVIFLPAVKKSQVPWIISHFDLCFIGGVHSILHKYGTSPNKVIDYMLASKPILQAIDEPLSMVEKVGCGICVEAENCNQIADSILKFYNMPAEERDIMGEKGRLYAERHLEWGNLAEEFLNWVL